MYNWRQLTEDEQQLLTSYYNINSKLPYIFFTLPKLFGGIYAISGMWEVLTNITTIPIAKIIYIIVTSTVTFALFWWVSSKLLELINQQNNALKNNTAQICSVVVLDKTQVLSHSRKHHHKHWKYIVEVNIYVNGKIKRCMVDTDSGSFANINIGELCNIVYFSADTEKSKPEFYMTAFDFDFKYVKRMINIYGKKE